MNSEIKRREFLKGLTALPVFAPLFGRRVFSQLTDASAAPRPLLHVYCHGLHAFVLYKDHILLLAPYVPGHTYLAGGWKKELDLQRGGSYSLQGVTNPAHPNLRPAINPNNLFLTGIKTVLPEKSYYRLILPYPTQFISLRYVTGKFSGKSAPVASNGEFPLLQVLQYEVYDAENLRLENFAAWTPAKDSGLQQLHIFAEPPMCVFDDHPTRAFDGLKDIFPEIDLHLDQSPDRAPHPSPDPNDALGLILDQELSLAERNGSCPEEVSAKAKGDVKGKTVRKGKHKCAQPDQATEKGAQPVNCFSVIVNGP